MDVQALHLSPLAGVLILLEMTLLKISAFLTPSCSMLTVVYLQDLGGLITMFSPIVIILLLGKM